MCTAIIQPKWNVCINKINKYIWFIKSKLKHIQKPIHYTTTTTTMTICVLFMESVFKRVQVCVMPWWNWFCLTQLRMFAELLSLPSVIYNNQPLKCTQFVTYTFIIIWEQWKSYMLQTLYIHHQGVHQVVLYKTHLIIFRWLKLDLLCNVSTNVVCQKCSM
jgi:hypothetical protein